MDEQKLGWGTTIGDVFPDEASAIHPDFRRVTLIHLLSHRAGLPHDADWWNLGRGLPLTQQRRRLLSRMRSRPPQRIGRGRSTSIPTWVTSLAGLMAEQVTGTPWEELMRRRLFQPLGMTSAGFGPPGKPGQVVQPWGHRGTGDELRPVLEDNAPSMGPAGTVHCSVPDWAKFASCSTSAARSEGIDRSSPRLSRPLHTPEAGRVLRGRLVHRRSVLGRRPVALNHDGSNTTWYCTIWLAPARDRGFLVATNAGGDQASKACDEAIGELIRIDGPDRPRGR